MNRHHLPRAARGSRQSPKSRLPRVLGAKSPIRALPLPFCFFNSQLSTFNFKLLTSCRSTFHPSNVPTFKPSKVQTIPSPRSHSRFGTHPSRIPDKIPPFFSCTYVEPVLQPFCFQTHAWNGGYRVCVATRLDAAPILAGEEERGMANFLEYNAEQAYLLPPTVREVLGEGHLCFFVHGAVEKLDL